MTDRTLPRAADREGSVDRAPEPEPHLHTPGNGGDTRPANPEGNGREENGRDTLAADRDADLDDLPALDTEHLAEAYRAMVVSREIDLREVALKRQNKSFFQISSIGHEAATAAAAALLRPSDDWVFAYYRDRALATRLGMTAKEQIASAWGAAEEPSGGGRQMPAHFSKRSLGLTIHSSCVGTQYLQAVGVAHASRYLARHSIPGLPAASDGIVLVCGGDGSTSEGEFWESLNSVSLRRLPVVYLIEDNGYAISVPVEHQTAGGNIAALVDGFPHLKVLECDGCDYEESYRTLSEAFAYARAGDGPALVRAQVVRPASHSLSDDDRDYKTPAELEGERSRDPILRLRDRLTASGAASREELDRLQRRTQAEVAGAAADALAMPWAPETSVLDHLYSPTVDPCSPEFETQPRSEEGAKPGTMVDLIRSTLRSEMARDPRIVLFGQDVADASREAVLREVKGKGGVFKVTAGLQREFGSERVFNSPLAEATIVGVGTGMAMRGLKPVVEVQFLDYLWPAYMQVRNELASLRWRSAGAYSCPVVIRVPVGGYVTGGGPYHSQSAEVLFTHLPGLRVVMPSTALEAAGLLRTAIRCDDPVLFLEHKHLYRQTYNKSPDPGPDFMIPFGKARVVRPGEDLTVVTYGALVHRAEVAAKQAAADGISVEILDLRSLAPYDWEAIRRSVARTNRVIVAYEDTRSFGYGAEIAARIADELFEDLDAPVRRVAAQDTWVAYCPGLERATLPQPEDLLRAFRSLAEY